MRFPILSISEVSTCNVTRITFRLEYGNEWLVFVWPLLLELIKQNELLSFVVFRSCSQLGVSSAVVDTGVMTPVHLPTLFPASPCNRGYLYSQEPMPELAYPRNATRLVKGQLFVSCHCRSCRHNYLRHRCWPTCLHDICVVVCSN